MTTKVSIGFSRPRTWKPLAALIMWIGGTDYSHTFVTWRCKAIERRKVFEAVGSGLRILSNKNFKKHALVVKGYSFEVSDEVVTEIEKIAHDMTGTSYGYWALIGIAIMKIFNFFNEKLRLKGRQNNPFKDGIESNICTEVGARILFKLLNKPLPIDIENYDLVDFEKMVKKHGKELPEELLERINSNF